jgi:uncharacterized phage infection (PIP) family protein YhgE
MKRFATIATVGATVCALSLAATVPAFADTTPPPKLDGTSSLAAIQAAGATQTAKRVTSLTTGIATLTAKTTLTAPDKASILSTLNADLNGMDALQAKIAADTTSATALADYRDIYTVWRVYAVGLHQSYLAASADGLTGTAIPRLQSAATKIAAVLAAKPSKITPALNEQLADMNAKIADAVSKTNGLAAAALAVTPSDFNANHSVLTSMTATAKAARADTKAAALDGRAILAALR